MADGQQPDVEAALTGGCLCGAIRFTVTSAPADAGYCHCTRCQRRTGTAASPALLVDGAGFRIDAGAELVTGWRHPDGGMEKCFCARCGAHLFSRDRAEAPTRVGIRVAALDAPPPIPFTYRQYLDDAAPWEAIPDDGLTRYPGSRFASA